MKKLISILTAFSLILSLAVPVFGANPTDTREDFTMEETIALILGSTVSYRVEYAGFDTPFTGTFKPELLTETDQTFKDYRAFFKFPIPYIGQYDLVSLQLIFNLPFEVKNLLSLEFALSPFYAKGDYRNISFTYQLDNNNASSGNQVVNSYSAIFSNNFYEPFSIVSGENSVNYYCSGDSPWILCNGKSANSGNMEYIKFGSKYNNNRVRIDGNFKDITTFGFTYIPTEGDGCELGFVFSPMSITYGSGGGYTPGGTTDPDPVDPDPVDPDPTDPTEPTTGEYAEQLDKIYNALVASGQIGQMQIQQNEDIINNQNEIKDKIDTITTPDDQTQQGVTDFENQVDENDKKLDDVAEGMKIDVPDIETEVDTSVIDDALTDDNFKSIMAVFWDNSRIISIFIASFVVSIFGVIFRGKRA